MANQWFRLYAEIINDPKVMIVTEALRWRYVALLCLHCNGQLKNRPDDEIALALRISIDDLIDTRKVLMNRNLLAEDGLPRGWEKRQFISDIKDPGAADRQRRYREKRNATVTHRNATVTSRLPESDTDTDTDTDKNKESAQVRPTPFGLNIDVWQRWFDFRKAIKKPIKPISVEAAQKALAAYGQDQEAVVEQSIANGWQGLFQLKTGEQNGQNQQSGGRDTRSKAKQHSDKLDEIARRSIERERAAGSLDCGDIQTLSGEIWAQVDVGNDRN